MRERKKEENNEQKLSDYAVKCCRRFNRLKV